jgi:hypothetical protein
MNNTEVKILIKNDEKHTRIHVMQTLAKIGIEYFDAKELITKIEEDGSASVLETSYSEALLKHRDVLVESGLDFEILPIL